MLLQRSRGDILCSIFYPLRRATKLVIGLKIKKSHTLRFIPLVSTGNNNEATTQIAINAE